MFWLLLCFGCATSPEVPPAPTPAPEVAPPPPPEPPPPPPKPTPPELGLAVASDAPGIAKQIESAEKALRNAEFESPDLREVGHLQQRVYRKLAKDKVLAAKVLTLVPEDIRSIVQRNTEATGAIARTVTKPRVDLPDWKMVEPAPADELLGYYKEAEAKHEVPWEVLAAIHLVETRMGRLRGTSYAGAQGPMQFMPPTWKAYGSGDVQDNHDAILSAGNYLAKMGATKDLDKAIWHYNHSDHYVSSVRTYAEIMEEDPNAFRGYHAWEVYYRTIKGSIWLAPGYDESKRISIASYCDKMGGEPYCPDLGEK